MADYESYRVLAGRIRMHVLDWAGESTPLLFLHGFTANAIAALNLGALLYERRRVIAPDLRGRGSSDMPFGEYGIDTHIKDVVACLDRLEIDEVVVSGHSFGAAISLMVAAQYPERVKGMILFDGGAAPSSAVVDYLNSYYDMLQYRYQTAEEYVARFKESPFFQPWTDELEALVRANLYQEPDGTYIRRVARYVVNTDRSGEHTAVWQQLPTLYPLVKCPVLIVRAEFGFTGTSDQMLPDAVIETMCAGMPSAQVVTVEQAGHTSLLTVPSETRDRAILHFLDHLS